MKDSQGQYPEGGRGERPDDSDTVEYETKRTRAVRGHGAAQSTRGYWVESQDSGSEVRGASAREARPPRDPRAAAGRARGRRNGGGRRRWVFVWMTLSLVVLVALAIGAVLTATGEIVVPGLSAKLFPIQYQDQIASIAAEHGQDPYLVAAMVKTESGFDVQAKSGAGAVGLMQLMPDTAEWVATKMGDWKGGSGPVLTDPADNLELGVWYLEYLGGLYGEGSLAALAAYNAGMGNVDDWIEAAGGAESFDASFILFPETRQYVERVGHYRQLFERVHPNAFD